MRAAPGPEARTSQPTYKGAVNIPNQASLACSPRWLLPEMKGKAPPPHLLGRVGKMDSGGVLKVTMALPVGHL